MRRALLTSRSKPNPLAGINIGDSFMGGYYAGIIDTTKGNIIAADASQTGLRYALIVSSKSLESATQSWKSPTSGTVPTAASTRWDGLSATAALAADAADYPAADYCAGLTYPTDAASAWYLPALDELELIYRNLKPTSENNRTTSRPANTFPGVSASMGENISSDPTGAAYTTTNPPQTSVAVFQSGGAQALGTSGVTRWHWSSTWAVNAGGTTNYAWQQNMSGLGSGQQGENTTAAPVRPVRRLLL